jgi:hypothetical protein
MKNFVLYNFSTRVLVSRHVYAQHDKAQCDADQWNDVIVLAIEVPNDCVEDSEEED